MAQRLLSEIYEDLDNIREFVRNAPFGDATRLAWIQVSLDLALTEAMEPLARGEKERAKAKRRKDRIRAGIVEGLEELPFADA